MSRLDRPGGLLRCPSILVLDSVLRKCKDSLKQGKADTAFVPEGLSSMQRPLPQRKSNKNTYCWAGVRIFNKLILLGKIRRPWIELLCQWLLQPWNMISAKINSFKNTWWFKDNTCWPGDTNEIEAGVQSCRYWRCSLRRQVKFIFNTKLKW